MTKRPSEHRRSASAGLGVAALGLLSLGCNDDPCAGVDLDAPPEPSPGPASPPTVLAGAWLGAGVLELQFSRPLSSSGDLDPSRFALVAWDAVTYDFGDYCSLQSRYRELGGGYFGYGAAGLDAVWVGPEDPTRLRLRVANGAARCPTLTGSIASGILLAYTDSPGDAPLLRDADGAPVPDLGPQWAIDDLDRCAGDEYSYYYSCGVGGYANGHLPALTSLAAIPCP